LAASKPWLVRLRSALLVNWPAKLTALLLSGVLWAAVAAEEPTTQLVPVALSVQPPPGRTLTGALPAVQAVYVGSTRELIKLYSSPPTIQRVLPDTLTGSEFDLTLSTQDLLTPTRLNVRAEDVQPRSVRIRLDEVVRRTLVVEPRVTITPDSGFALQGGIAVEPGSVTVTGPDAILRDLAAIATVPLEMSGVNSAVRRRVSLDTTGLGAARLMPSDVEISADVAFMAERVLMGVPVAVRAERPAGLVADPPAVLVTVRGPSLRLARLTRDSVLVLATPTADGPERVLLEVVPPEGLSGIATPDSVTVTRRPRG
jgi:YbbR-like protein